MVGAVEGVLLLEHKELAVLVEVVMETLLQVEQQILAAVAVVEFQLALAALEL
jgi:hypothetical protein